MYTLMSDFKVLLPNHHVNKGKLRRSLMMAVMDVDLLLGIEQALILNIVLCIFDVDGCSCDHCLLFTFGRG